jgi:tetratricopeptide (TPR) repeat protein
MANKKDRLTNELSKYVGLGQWAKAVQTLQGLIQLEPTNTHYYLRMGDYSLKAGNKAGAVKHYYEAADMYVKAGFSVKAIATYKMILRIAPGETQATTLMKSVTTQSGGIAFDDSFVDPQQARAAEKDDAVLDPVVADEPLDKADVAEESASFVPASLPDTLENLEVADPVPLEVADPTPSEVSSELSMSDAPVAARKLSDTKNIDQLFASFTPDEFGAIVEKLEPLEFIEGERIIAEGEEGDGMYLITRGGGKVVKEHKGQEVELCELGEGEFFGELSLLVGGPPSASVFAKAETEVLRLRSADLFVVIKQYPRVESVLEHFARAMHMKMRDLPE